jgi:hypothetical protein
MISIDKEIIMVQSPYDVCDVCRLNPPQPGKHQSAVIPESFNEMILGGIDKYEGR